MSTITKERLQRLIRAIDSGSYDEEEIVGWVNSDEIMELARIALASLEAEPVAWRYRTTDINGNHNPNWSFSEEASLLGLYQPLYTAPPAPVSVPLAIHDEDFEEALSVLNDTLDDCGDSERGLLLALDKVGIEVRSDARRAAMLQGADGNSPVIPDCWVACSERMPDNDDFVYIWPRPDFGVELHVAQYGKFDKRDAGWYAQVYEQNYGIEYHPITVTHWQPLPAAPQQE